MQATAYVQQVQVKTEKAIFTVKNTLMVAYLNLMFCNSLLKVLIELQATMEEGKLFHNRMESGKNERW